jgi:hypothetical protein
MLRRTFLPCLPYPCDSWCRNKRGREPRSTAPFPNTSVEHRAGIAAGTGGFAYPQPWDDNLNINLLEAQPSLTMFQVRGKK